MNVHAPEPDVKPVRSGDCGCGCGGKCGCESRCCDLECIVRPRFFCGQVLTDADLGATVEWARNRFALTRYRHGWGVVCGLDMTCSDRGHDECCPNPRNGPTVYVHPGYAIDCCGNDLVVCEPLAVDLRDVCRPLEDPCDPVWKPKPAEPRNTDQGSNVEGTPEQSDRTPRVDCWNTMREGLVAVNLSLRYHEDLAHGQRAMFRSGCSDVGSCEYTRVLEHPCVHAELGAVDCKDDTDDWQLWQREFETKRAGVQREIGQALRLGSEGVLRYLRRYPPFKFCFLEELVCCLRGGEQTDERSEDYKREESSDLRGDDWRRVRFWLYLDWYLHQFECDCWSCKPDRGVPLARVLLQRVERRGEQTCRVVLIDTSVPHRRPLHKDGCRPVPRGAIDLAPYLWQPVSYATERLRAAGVRLSRTPARTDADLLTTVDAGVLWLDSDSTRVLYAIVIKDPFDCERIVAFDTADV